jgi:putative transposase
LSVVRQCELLGLPRSTMYYEPRPESASNLKLMRLIDEQFLRTPFYGSRRIMVALQRQGHVLNRKRVQRLMRLMNLETIHPKPRTSVPGKGHTIYPYLLRNLEITRPNQVWSADITYVPMRQGFLYLVAILDWYSRYVVAWKLSNSLDETFCVEALEEALAGARPEIFTTDQGVQFTGRAFTGRLQSAGVAISMDGKGRALDNVFVERLWRALKYEEIYLKDYAEVADCRKGLAYYFPFYNHERPHMHLAYRTPWEVYQGKQTKNRQRGQVLLIRNSRVANGRTGAGRVKGGLVGPCSAP